MTPADYIHHREWMRFKRSQTLARIREDIGRLEATRQYGWDGGYPCEIPDLIERLRGLMPECTAETANWSTSSTEATIGRVGNALPTRPPANPTTSAAGSKNHTSSAGISIELETAMNTLLARTV